MVPRPHCSANGPLASLESSIAPSAALQLASPTRLKLSSPLVASISVVQPPEPPPAAAQAPSAAMSERTRTRDAIGFIGRLLVVVLGEFAAASRHLAGSTRI